MDVYSIGVGCGEGSRFMKTFQNREGDPIVGGRLHGLLQQSLDDSREKMAS